MREVDIIAFQANVSSMLERVISHNEPLKICAGVGNAVVLSEEYYRGMLETLQLLSVPEMREKLLQGRTPPLSECVPESELW